MLRINRRLAATLLTLTTLAGAATAAPAQVPLAIPEQQATGNCWEDAARTYGINAWLLYAIAEKESSLNPHAINSQNTNGTRDIGLMQVNSFWLPILEQYGIGESDLFKPCTSIFVGAWILAQNFRIYGKSWQAVGAYNVGTESSEKADGLRRRYAEDVRNRFNRHVSRLLANSR